ncbi:MAG TPA: PhzF family phenazine biosynthesis protein [Actinomycetota bacterium]|nr:PhzF family phenazine biosynthesis protein [Actinomycetota bacterium]
MAFRLVDVFGTEPFSGNQLCVVPDARDLDDRTMQVLAREIGFSETTFVTEARGERYAMRIFTPGGELPFAGHPSLGTAYILVAEGRVGSPAVQVVAAGEFPVEVDLAASRASLAAVAATPGPAVDRRRAAAAAGLVGDDLDPDLPPQVASAGLPFLVVPARDPRAVARARPGEPTLGPLLAEVGADGLYLVATVGEDAYRARMFDATLGIGEDAATGSAALALGAYLLGLGRAGRFTILQGAEVGRPSVLEVEAAPGPAGPRVTVAGQVHVVGDGRFRLAG